MNIQRQNRLTGPQGGRHLDAESKNKRQLLSQLPFVLVRVLRFELRAS